MENTGFTLSEWSFPWDGSLCSQQGSVLGWLLKRNIPDKFTPEDNNTFNA
jgi:hypothetical protein